MKHGSGIVSLVCLLVACAGESPPGQDNAPAERTLPVQAVEVTPRDLSRVVRVASPVEPLRTIRLAARTDGVLTEVLVEEGDRVDAGQVLARIDVSEQRAELARAEARLRHSRANHDRLLRLEGSGHVDEASLETGRAELEIARSEVELWATRVGFGDVRSSIDGTVVRMHAESGEAVTRHEPLFDIVDLDTLVIRPGVSELDVHDLEVGSAVNVDVDALGRGQSVEASIRRIFPAADPASRLVTVEIQLPGASGAGIRPGYLARATLQVDRRSGVLAVPAGALAEMDGGHYVMVIDADDRLERRRVEAGVARGNWREIVAGLEPGELVVATNPLDMNEGTRVRIVGFAG